MATLPGGVLNIDLFLKIEQNLRGFCLLGFPGLDDVDHTFGNRDVLHKIPIKFYPKNKNNIYI